MEKLTCYCLKCKSELARFSNSWDAIGTTYHSPVQPPSSITGLETTGLAYGTAPESSIENSSLQDVACTKCQTTLGLQCYSAPEGHLLKTEQLILNLSLMSVISEVTGKEATVSVRKSIPLTKGTGKRASVSRRSSAQPVVRTHTQSVPPPSRPPVPLFNANTPKTPIMQTPLSLPLSFPRGQSSDSEKFRSWAENVIRSQQKDIDRVSGTVDRIERDMKLFKDFMEEVRTELASIRETRSQPQDDLLMFQNQVGGTVRQPKSREGVDASSKSLDAITKDTLIVNHKVHDVNRIEDDLGQIRDRLKSLEEKASQTTVPGIEAQLKEMVPTSVPKRRLQENDNLHTPGNPESPPRHRSKRTRTSDKNVDGPPNDSLDEFYDTSLVAITHGEEEITVNSEPDHGETMLPPTSTNIARPGQHMPSDFDVSILTRQLGDSNSGEPSTRRRRSDVNYAIPMLSAKRRNSHGVLVGANGKVDRRSLRRKKSTLAQEIDAPSETLEPSIASPTAKISNNQDDQEPDELMGSIEAGLYSTPVPSIPRLPRFFTPVNVTPMAGDSPFMCGVCKRGYPSFHALTAHHEHNDGCEDKTHDETPKPKNSKPFKCGSCNKGYTSINALNYHHDHSKTCSETAFDDLPTCPSCGKTYKVLFRLERHIELGACTLKGYTSNAESPLLTCNACGNPFKTQGELEGHQCSRVKLHSLNFREASLAAREVVLLERERLVRQTMEREMMDIR